MHYYSVLPYIEYTVMVKHVRSKMSILVRQTGQLIFQKTFHVHKELAMPERVNMERLCTRHP